MVCCLSEDPFTVEGYLIAALFADYGHTYVISQSPGLEALWLLRTWNDVV